MAGCIVKKLCFLPWAVCFIWLFGYNILYADVPKTHIISSGGVHGNYYQVAKFMTSIFNQYQDLQMSVISSGGSKQNFLRLSYNNANYAIIQNDVLAGCLGKYDDFETMHAKVKQYYQECMSNNSTIPIKAISALYPEFVQPVVRRNSHMLYVQDIRNTRIYLMNKNSGSYANALSLLHSAHISLDNVRIVEDLGTLTPLEALKNNIIDVFFITRGALYPYQESLLQDIKLLSISNTTKKNLLYRYPFYKLKKFQDPFDNILRTIPYVSAVFVTNSTNAKKNYDIAKALVVHHNKLSALNREILDDTYIGFFEPNSHKYSNIYPLADGVKDAYLDLGIYRNNVIY